MILLLLLIQFVLLYPTQIKYAVGNEINYNLTSHINAQGHLVQGGTTQGSTSILTGIVAIKCVKQYTSDSWLLVMNMFNTEVGVGSGQDSEFEKRPLSSSNDAQPLGDDMYFEHKFDGSIPTIWYQKGDSPILVQIKVSAINAFQTHLVKPLQTVKNVQFKDPAGDYYATMVGGKDSEIFGVTKDFDQSFFKAFSDPAVKPENLQMSGSTVTNVHTSGYVHSANLGQTVVMKNMQHFNSRRSSTEGFDMNLGSIGQLALNVLQGDDAPKSELLPGNREMSDKQLVQSTLFETAKEHIVISKEAFDETDLEEQVGKLVNSLFSSDSEVSYLKLHKLINLLKVDKGKKIVETSLLPVFKKLNVLSRGQSDALFFALSQLDLPSIPVLFVKFGLKSKIERVQIQSILSSQSIMKPSTFLLDALLELYNDESVEKEIRLTSILAFGTGLKRLTVEEEKSKYLSTLHKLLEKHSDSASEAVPLLYSFMNTNEDLPESIYDLFKDSKDIVIHEILSLYKTQQELENDDFPFYKELSKNYTLGGKTIGVTFSGELFAGTNFDCNHEYFNFKLLAQILGTGDFLGVKEKFLDGHVIYGQAQGVKLADEIYLSLFGKVLYQKSIPSIDCIGHTYPLYHSEPGIRLSYTLWISIIPVTFSLAVDVGLDLSWGWEVCLDKLYLEAELIPGASVIVTAGANINLLIVRAGVEVEGKLGPVEVIPQGYIDGAKCEVGFDVKLKIPDPVHAQLDTYYQFKKCKFLIFDCHWDKEHEKIWWQYNGSPVDKTLFNEVWKIAK